MDRQFFYRQLFKAVFIGFVSWLAVVAPDAGLIVVGLVMLVGLYGMFWSVSEAIKALKGMKRKRLPPD